MKKKENPELLDSMHKNPDNWNGVIYFNRKDPRVIVPKITPLTGWTLNFGNLWSYIGLLAIISIILASQYIL